MKKQDFIDIINDILNVGIIENKPIKNIKILKSILKDDNLVNQFYLEFKKHFFIENNLEMLFCKTQDFIYRLNMAINDWLIPVHGINTIKEIKSKLVDLVYENIDLYSAVSYDESDKEIIEDFEDSFPKKII